MRAPASLTARLILVLALGATVLWLVGALATAGLLRARLDEAFDGGLQETAERLLPLAMDGMHDDGDGDFDGREVPELDPGQDEYIVYQVRRSDGKVVLRSHDAPAEGFAAPLSNGFSETGNWRVFTLAEPRGRLLIQVAEAVSHRIDTLSASLLVLLLPVVLLIPLSVVGILLAVRRGLLPLRRLSEDVGRRDAGNLTPIDTAGLPVELRPIGDAIQALIERVSAALAGERAFSSNASHEMRTPIAGSLAQTQRLLAELEQHPARARAAQVEETLRRLRSLIEKLLELSRADARVALADEPSDLLPALRLLVDDSTRAGEVIGLEVAPGATLRSRLDIDAFGIIMRNLIENAVRHREPGTGITVVVRSDGGIEVINAAPVIPADKLAKLRQRFQRGQTLAPGSGLGLAIVDTLLTQAGGTLTLHSPIPGRADGFCAEVRLPD